MSKKEEENRLLKYRLAQLEEKLDQVEETTKEVKGKVEGKNKKIAIENEKPIPDPILIEELVMKAIKSMSGKALEVIALLNEKLEENLIMD